MNYTPDGTPVANLARLAFACQIARAAFTNLVRQNGFPIGQAVFNLANTFAVIKPDQRVEPVAVSPSVYQQLDERFDGFRGHTLIAEYAFSSDWNSWERHPAGDETVVLLSGRAELILRQHDGDESHTLDAAGDTVILPAGCWHQAKV